MSSYDPDELDKRSSHDPGVMEREITEERDFSNTLSRFDRLDFVLLGLFLSIPAGILTSFLLMEFFPGFQDTAADLLEEIVDLASRILPFGRT